VSPSLVHTGQHYSPALSEAFFRDLGIPAPDATLDVGSGSHARQTARVMVRLETHLVRHPADRLVVVGDVNSTLAAALVGAKLGIPVDHVEAGLRSGDRSMPEEINRVVTDSVASRFFASEPAAVRNLVAEGHARDSIFLVGNVMIDSLARIAPKARRRAIHRELGLDRRGYGIVTLHRPSNVDDPERLKSVLRALGESAQQLPLVLPVHPRTRRALRGLELPRGLRLLEPLGYLDFLSLLIASRLVVTDSGGVQEETTYLGIPCLTLRDTTERPITVSLGTNTLVGTRPETLPGRIRAILAGRYKQGASPALWDGRAARRIADVIAAPERGPRVTPG
jgi:UDP-N-acetylglucosamine 2-epimerase (non-hydrolysing)